MKTRKLGDRLEVSALGYGAMVLEGSYGAIDRKAAETALGHALERGMTLIDTADVYGDGENERLVGRALAQRVTEAVVSTKWGFARPGPSARRVETSYATDVWIDARPERARIAAAASLSRLGIEAIALWYLHFPDPGIPIEETVGAMASLVKEGAVLHLGLSNVTSDELRRACQVHPIAAVQVEWSLWTREPNEPSSRPPANLESASSHGALSGEGSSGPR